VEASQDSTPDCCNADATTDLTSFTTRLQEAVTTLQAALEAVHHCEDAKEQAQLARVLRLETMEEIRATVDAAEAVVPAHLWTLATYKELLFMDQHHVA
jgi:glutamine synthetase